MGWKEKTASFSFEQQPIAGLFFLDGDLIARANPRLKWNKGMKYPMIEFPSGTVCELWESRDPTNGIVHIFGELDLPLKATHDEAFTRASDVAEQLGYLVRKAGEDTIEAVGSDDEQIRIIYDNITHHLSDVVYVRRNDALQTTRRLEQIDENENTMERYAQWDRALEERDAMQANDVSTPELLDAKTRTALPPLYSGEKLGLDALAQVKFFTPDAHWTWYGSEFDGENIFFGLVAGDEIELGYFSLDELADANGPLGLAIERDRFFTPTSLRELQERHIRERSTSPESSEFVDPRAETLLTLKEDILIRFHQLPSEHQASLSVVLIRDVMKGEWGAWLKDAFTRQHLNTALFPVVQRDNLKALDLSAAEIAQIADADLAAIAQRMQEHYTEDVFWDELNYRVEQLLEQKRTQSDT